MSCEPAFDYHRLGSPPGNIGEAAGRAGRRPRSPARATLRLTAACGSKAGGPGSARMKVTTCSSPRLDQTPPPQTYDEAADKMANPVLAAVDQHQPSLTTHGGRTCSALALKGWLLPTPGALLAASATSLPETPRGERSWDHMPGFATRPSRWRGLYTLGLDRKPTTSLRSSPRRANN